MVQQKSAGKLQIAIANGSFEEVQYFLLKKGDIP